MDIVFCAHNRLEFTRISLAFLMTSTNWDLVDRMLIYDDLSSDGSERLASDLLRLKTWPEEWRGWKQVRRVYVRGKFGGPVAIMNDYLSQKADADYFVKIDNDTVVPPGWLDQALSTFSHQGRYLDLLGIEPPLSRKAAAPWHEGVVPTPEMTTVAAAVGFGRCDAIGGIGVMRRAAFEDREAMKPFATYGGFTDWQLAHPELAKAWIAPPLNVFLLDRLPFPPFTTLSADYVAKNWQRPWTLYRPEDSRLWDWAIKAATFPSAV